jgi:hypothetical protein
MNKPDIGPRLACSPYHADSGGKTAAIPQYPVKNLAVFVAAALAQADPQLAKL